MWRFLPGWRSWLRWRESAWLPDSSFRSLPALHGAVDPLITAGDQGEGILASLGVSPPVGVDPQEEAAFPVAVAGSVAVGLPAVGRVVVDRDSMRDLIERFISKADQHKIESCVREAESRTRGEIVVMVVPGSYHYPMANLLGAASFSLPVAIALTPEVGGLFWAGPWNLWAFLAVLIPLILIFHQVVKRVHLLKRWFISGKEMEDEVREAAYIQFFRKGLYRTVEETGVLIYISVFERRVWVLGDRGINAVIPEAQWQRAVATIVQAIQERRQAEGICQAVREVGKILRDKFPIKSSDQDELQNLIVEQGPLP
jgi:putative membrane protein